MANLAFRAAASGGDNTFSVSSVTATLPTGTVQNDLGVIWYTSASLAPTAAPTHTTPSGWTLAGTFVFNGMAAGLINGRVSLFYQIEPASPGSATLTSSATCAHAWTRLSYDNPDTAAPFGQVTFNSWTGTSVVASSITTSKANALIAMYVAQGTAQACTPDASLTERSDNTTYGVEEADAIQATAGATGNKTATVTTSTNGMWGLAEFWSERPSMAHKRSFPMSILQH